MTFSKIGAAPRMLHKHEAGAYVGGPTMLLQMEKANPPWLRPAVARHKMTLYDVKTLDACCDRLSLGEYPKPISEAATL